MNKSEIIYYASKTAAHNPDIFYKYILNLIGVLHEKGISKAIFIMHDVRFHKNESIRNLITDNNFESPFLPPYSLFLNPLTSMFSKWKEMTKRASQGTESELMELFESIKNLITVSDCEEYFRNINSCISLV